MSRIPRAVWLFAILLAVVTSLPYLALWLNAPEGWTYSGAAAHPGSAVVDYNTYLAAMRLGERGEVSYRLLFTHEDHPALPLVKGFRVALGWTARLTGVSLALTYYLARFLLTMGAVLALWTLAAHFFQDTAARWYCVLFATLVGGWSWLIYLIPVGRSDISPIEFWLIDAFNFLGLFYAAHFALAIILQVVAVVAFERWMARGRWPSLAVLTLALAGLSVVQPYVILLTGGLFGIMAAYYLLFAPPISAPPLNPLPTGWRGDLSRQQSPPLHRVERGPGGEVKPRFRQRALWLAIPMGVHAALIGYQYAAIRSDPVWSAFADQNDTLSPPVIYYLLGYLPLLIPAALSLRAPGQRDRLIAWVWIGLVAVLLYLPLPTQRRYALGLQTALAIPAAAGWAHVVLPRLRPRSRPLATIIYLAFGSISLLLILAVNISAALNQEQVARVYYMPDAQAGYRWLQTHSAPDDLILTTFNASGQGSGGALVAATGRRVFLGHWIETVDFDRKNEQIARFYDRATDDAWRCAFLREIVAGYVWYDDYARATGDWQPTASPCLRVEFEQGTVAIFRVSGE